MRPDAAGKLYMKFGPLNSEEGLRRLNVAISGARHGIVIYNALKPEQIDRRKAHAAGVRDLKHGLEFANRGPQALVEQAVPMELAPDSPSETAVIGLLRNNGWVIHPQEGCSHYLVDTGVVERACPFFCLNGLDIS